MSAGLKTLELISTPGFYDQLAAKVEQLVEGILQQAREAGIPMTANRVGGMFGLFFTEAERVSDFAGATACDQERFKRFFHAMLERGVYLAPSAYEAGFVSAAHSEADIQVTIDAAKDAFGNLG
jgi:glutamate-1-semialdehyde 2,1-aminomutase